MAGFEILGEWEIGTGSSLSLKARENTEYASIWLSHDGKPVRIGCALHANGVVRRVSWEPPWAEQTDAWKVQQQGYIAALIAAWHADQSRSTDAPTLPASVIGTFDVWGFRFAVEPTTAPEHVILSIINVEGGLTPVADLLHEDGLICGLAVRPGWRGTPDDRRRVWRREAEAILIRAADLGRL
ncbi:hypothetical protein [Glycomyces halotolerans]